MKLKPLRTQTLGAGSQRRQRGSALIELAAIGFIVVAMALLSVNIGLLVFAAWANDSACRDACRAAAQQSTDDDARAAAILACKQFATGTGSIAGSPQVLTDAQHFKYEAYLDEDGRPQMDKGPYVLVSTQLNTKLPAPILFSTVGFTDQISFKQTYTFPLLNPGTEDIDDTIDQSLTEQEEADIAEVLAADQDGAAETIDPDPTPVTPVEEPAPVDGGGGEGDEEEEGP